MAATAAALTPEEIASLGAELYGRQIKPLLKPEDDGKLVTLDVLSGDFEIGDDLRAAVNALRARRPGGEFWTERAGHPAVYALLTPFILDGQ